jgi:hypothetical protein
MPNFSDRILPTFSNTASSPRASPAFRIAHPLSYPGQAAASNNPIASQASQSPPPLPPALSIHLRRQRAIPAPACRILQIMSALLVV